MRTPLYEEHVELGAKMTEFAGWEMPLQYAGIAHEVEVVRTKVGLFDISHMGEFVISGPHALALVQYVTTNDASALEVGKAQYSLLCDENGGVIDDLIVYRTGEQEYLLVVNASNEKSDFEWIASHNAFGATLENQSADTALIALQGPLAERVMYPLAAFDAASLGRFGITRGKVAGIDCHVARTGYTGEDGFEIFCAASGAVDLWTSLMVAKVLGAEPIGLGARDVLRLEAAYPLYGHELTRDTTPVAARLMWVVKPDKGDFIGRDAILSAKQTGEKRTLVGIEAIDRCIPRHGCDVMNQGAVVGSITSGTFSPTLGKAIALAYIDKASAVVGTEVEVVTSFDKLRMRGRTCACRVVPTPFYKKQRG
jgi:aminomethyltransferase